jgi:hypothetical protein
MFGSAGNLTDTARAVFASVAGEFTTDKQHLSAIQDRVLSNIGDGSGVANVAGGSVDAPGHKTYMAAGALPRPRHLKENSNRWSQYRSYAMVFHSLLSPVFQQKCKLSYFIQKTIHP